MSSLSNSKWELFAVAVAGGQSATQAYLAAGYKTNAHAASISASRLLENPSIKARIAEVHDGRERASREATADAIAAASLTKQWVIERLMENAERALQRVAVKDSEGHPTGEYRYEGSVANRALELLGKEQGMFIDRKEVGKPGEFDGLNTDDLRSFVAREAEALGLSTTPAPPLNGSGKPH